MSSASIKLPTHPDGSGDVMGIYGVMFAQSSSRGKVHIAEGSLKTIHSLLHQPYVTHALNRGVSIDVLYTGPKPANPEEERMWQEIGELANERRIPAAPFNESVKIMQEDMLGVYRSSGAEGLAKHLTSVVRLNGKPMEYSQARNLAECFERDVAEGRIK